jgi:hypothetical protein
VDTVLPKFVQDLSSLEVSPMDGQTLTEALHANGINMRYLGKVSVVLLIHEIAMLEISLQFVLMLLCLPNYLNN